MTGMNDLVDLLADGLRELLGGVHLQTRVLVRDGRGDGGHVGVGDQHDHPVGHDIADAEDPLRVLEVSRRRTGSAPRSRRAARRPRSAIRLRTPPGLPLSSPDCRLRIDSMMIVPLSGRKRSRSSGVTGSPADASSAMSRTDSSEPPALRVICRERTGTTACTPGTDAARSRSARCEQGDGVEGIAGPLLDHPELAGHLLEDLPGPAPAAVEGQHGQDEEDGERRRPPPRWRSGLSPRTGCVGLPVPSAPLLPIPPGWGSTP